MTHYPNEFGLPEHRELYYGGRWHGPASGKYIEIHSPGNGVSLGTVGEAGSEDIDRAVAAASAGFAAWREVKPVERSKLLRKMAGVITQNARELAYLDAVDCGNPVTEMLADAAYAAAQLDFFAGLVSEMKGYSMPIGPDGVVYSLREPRGVVARIVPFNHPFMFVAGKSAAPLAAGNAVIMKPAEQAPLSSLRMAELFDGLLPPGVLNIVPGGAEAGAALSSHPGIAMVALVGSVPTGKAVMRAAADTVKPVLLELGGKNALIACADCDPTEIAKAVVSGMNFTWCSQSCGSTSRAFVHRSIYDAVLREVGTFASAYKPGLPTDPFTNMGALINRRQHDRVRSYIESAKRDGARLICGGDVPQDPRLADGFYFNPTVFADVKPSMSIAREEIFGPVLSVFPWSDEAEMLAEVNAVDYGLTCSIWTDDLGTAHRLIAAVEAGYVWVNETSKHFLGASFGGYKQSGLGKEESLEELLAFTQEKNVHIRTRSRKAI
ncbi:MULTISPECIES: aldehyde dehydrogenase family protein [Neorhizobium]|uniref:aldehyde dehydrogenase family protein n=1 Tax=Neorhizobium TaxID=1525371 RepID=UPI000CF9172C|nr:MULTISPECIES: aldehyde dehydrogenase family protein [Neorhizobium]